MADQLEQLVPISEIMGSTGVKASYSDHTLWNTNSGRYMPGWKIEVDGVYKGARIQFSEEAASLDDAANAALARLRKALGLK